MTEISKKLYEELHLKYESLKSVCKTFFSENNPENDGRKHPESKSELEENFEAVLSTLTDVIHDQPSDNPHYIRLISMKASIYYEQAKILVTENREGSAKQLLEQGLELIREYSKRPDVCFLYLRIANHYAFLLSRCSELKPACELLEEMEEIYYQITKADVRIFNTDDLFVPEEKPNLRNDSTQKLEKLVTNNLQMLGWVYSQQKQYEKFSVYHHLVLRRQLEMRDGNALVWALKTARLASYFLSASNCKQARHHLAAASSVLEEYEQDLKKSRTSDSVLLKWDELEHYYADVAKCWTKYGLYLFSISKNKIVQSLYGEQHQRLEDLWTSPFTKDAKKETEKPQVSPETSKNPDETIFLEFPSLNLKIIEAQVSCELVKNVEEARNLFMFTHTWLKRSKIFYTIKDHPLEYINGILDLSELYRYLAFFEDDIEVQYSVQKRRADSLETLCAVLREIRPQCYLAVSIELLRELAEVQMEMMGLNLRRLCAIKEGGDAHRQTTIHKMEAVADIHARLQQFGEIQFPGSIGQDDGDYDDKTSDTDEEVEGDDEDSDSEPEMKVKNVEKVEVGKKQATSS